MAETQIFIKLLNNKTLTLQFPPQTLITPQLITSQIPNFNSQTLTLILNGKLLSSTIKIPNFSTLTLSLPLNGGKGGFGSLLRGAATKAGQKKTNNFDACRDMSGRRLRHVNAEKKMEEWKLEEDERKLEKKAEKFLKDLAMKGKGGKRDDGAEKYVEKYREVSKRCVEDVDKSVREAAKAVVGGRKRKGSEGVVDAKKLKIWMGKRKLTESDSDGSDGDTESDDSDAENDKSAVTDNGSHSDSSKDVSNSSIAMPQLGGNHNVLGSSDSDSEQPKEILTESSVKIDSTSIESEIQSSSDGHMEALSDKEENMFEKPCVSTEVASIPAHVVSDQLESKSAVVKVDGTQAEPVDRDVHGDSECKTAFPEEVVVERSIVSEVPKPLNFDDFGSASDLEVLGMERLKSELQERGLKCGGTLQERAARLFLLKTTPLEKLPKKLLAKK